MISRPDKNAVIELNYHPMNTNNAVLRPRIRGRSRPFRPFRSLFSAVADALLLTAAFVPRANATLIVYFNFEDDPTMGGRNGVFDNFSDQTFLVPGEDINTGGGDQFSTLSLTTNADASTAGGILDNRSAGDQDPANHVPPSFNGHALLLNNTINTSATLCFTVDTTLLTGLSLSFATDNNGNGYANVELQFTVTGANAGTYSAGTQPLPTKGTATTTFTSAMIDPTNSIFTGSGGPQSTEFCLVLTGGRSQGNDRQTVIDNIQLTATEVPEPATVAGGLLGLCGLCWHQRRRLIRFTRLRRA